MNKIFILFSIFALANCANSTNAPPKLSNEIKGKWVLESLNNEKATSYGIYIELNENKISGYSGCNRYFGDYTINSNKIKFGQIGMTLMACMDNKQMAIEQKYATILDGEKVFELKNDNLTIKNSDNSIGAIFHR